MIKLLRVIKDEMNREQLQGVLKLKDRKRPLHKEVNIPR